MQFHLLQLPLVAIQEVLKCSELKNIFHLSICSKKSNHIAVWSLRKNSKCAEFELDCKTSPNEITFSKKNGTFKEMVAFQPLSNLSEMIPKSIEYVSIGGYTVPFVSSDRCFTTFWTDRDTGLKTLLHHISRLFHVDFSCFVFEQPDLPLLEWIFDRQVLDAAHCDARMEPDVYYSREECSRVLTNCRVRNLVFNATFPDGFVFDGILHQFETIQIHDGRWITTENLRSLGETCREFDISNTNMTCLELNQFLRHWVNGGMHRLEFFRIVLDTNDLETVIADLPMVPIDERFHSTCYRNYVYWFPAGNAIRRGDGTTASIFYDTYCASFLFAVWKN